jgi:hypothetical protein
VAILETDNTIEQLETNVGLTKLKEFKYSYNENIFVPSGVAYHKIVTKNKEVVYQTFNKPIPPSEKIIRVKNKTALEDYLLARASKPKRSRYFTDTKVKPKLADYSTGFFERYFMQLATDDKAPILEVTKKSYNEADAMYRKIKIRWSLSKDIKEQEKLNLDNILKVEKTFSQIRMKIYNFVEFHKSK